MARRKRTPESFLALAKAEAPRAAEKGRLKIFLGAAPGVGKTYSMLQAAQAKRRDLDGILVGIAETHGRAETLALLGGLEVLSRREVEHRGVKLTEFDLDAALARRPSLILVDELAHTNAPGSRHAKRWQDVLELLDRGLDVYTTLNIQHLESLNDIVAQITGVTVRETVPDSLLERADVELVDLPPEELLERLKAGKVYIPEQAARARDGFFKLSNLAALRELSLRTTAEGVNAVVQSQRLLQAPETIWATTERLLVCVGPGPNSAKLVRAARRMAAGFNAEWLAVSVQPPGMSEGSRAAAVENLRLAERLGAETLVLAARDVVETVIDLARQRNATKIVVGKHEGSGWKERVFGSIVDELIRRSGEIDIYVIRGEAGEAMPAPARAAEPHAPFAEYALAAAAVGVCTAIAFAVFQFLEPTNLVMVYLLGTLVVALRGHRGPAILFSVMSVLCFDFFFVPPRFTFAVTDSQYALTFLVMLAVGVLISHLTLRVRAQAEAARLGEMRTVTMHALSRELASTRGLDPILETAVRHIAQVFESDVVALIPVKAGPLEARAWSGQKRELDEKERSVAQWVFDLGQSAGLGTQTLPVVDALYAPLTGSEGSAGVLRVQPKVRERLLIPDQMLLLESFAHQIGLALEVDRLQESARQSQISVEAERLRSSLLSSISHDLRTPLAAILGSATTLLQTGAPEPGRELILNIREEAERLSRLVNNLLEATRLESGVVRLRKEPQAIEEVAGVALARLEKALGGREVKTDLPEHLPLVPVDAVLMEQVFVNLIENAVRHTPPGGPIEISARAEGESLVVAVSDRGPGLAADDLSRVFEKFYRAKTTAAGAGLGLAICKAILDAHDGRIWAENREGGGASFRFALPFKGAP